MIKTFAFYLWEKLGERDLYPNIMKVLIITPRCEPAENKWDSCFLQTLIIGHFHHIRHAKIFSYNLPTFFCLADWLWCKIFNSKYEMLPFNQNITKFLSVKISKILTGYYLDLALWIRTKILCYGQYAPDVYCWKMIAPKKSKSKVCNKDRMINVKTLSKTRQAYMNGAVMLYLL